MDWAGGQYEIDFLKKMLVWEWVVFFKNNNTVRERGWGWEMALLQTSEKSARTKMMLTELKPTLRSMWELFLEISGQFLRNWREERFSSHFSI